MSLALTAAAAAVGAAAILYVLKNKKSKPMQTFDYESIKATLTHADALGPVEECFAKLAAGEVNVPFPMHIGIPETPAAGPGDCHIKGGYVVGSQTFTVKMGCVSFYKNVEKGLPPGGGMFIVMSAETGAPLGVFQENRYMTDLRTGAAGAVALKHLSDPSTTPTIAFIGAGKIATDMAKSAVLVRPGFKGVAYARNGSDKFCESMTTALPGCTFTSAATAEEACKMADVIFTTTTGKEVVLQKAWLKPNALIIAAGSDQPTKQELPPEVLKAGKYVTDLTKQCARVGELRSAISAGVMTEGDVYAELGEIVSGKKAGRKAGESGIIVCDLTGTGAQDAAIGQVAWDKMKA